MSQEIELVFKYEEVLADENLQLSDLPVEIRKQINAIKPNYGRYQNNPSEEMRNALIKQDIDVSNKILDWLEEHAEEEEEARIKAEEEAAAQLKAQEEEAARIKAEEEAAAQTKAQEEEAARIKAEEEAAAQTKAEEEAAAQTKAEEEEAARIKAEEEAKAEEAKNYKFGTPEMVSDINEKIEKNGGHILISELELIIGKKPDYPHQEVYNLKLHKPYMKSFYKVV